MRPPYWKIGLSGVFGTLLLVTGTGLLVCFDSIWIDVLKDELILAPNSKSFKIWEKTPVPMYLELYLFNWTNPAEFGINQKEKPHFVEMGPYVFREVDTKIIKSWNKNGTLTFKQKREWIFEPNLSNGTLDDRVTNLNPVTATILYMTRFRNAFLKDIINLALNKMEGRTITKKVRELLFDGYEDKLLSYGSQIISLPFDKFGWFYQRNGSENYDGIFNMRTGVNNIYNMGMVDAWDYKNLSATYSGKCANVEGSIGDFWPPLLNNKSLSIFSPDICTVLSLEVDGTSDYLGLTGQKFASNVNTLDNGTNVPSRKCYCDNSECQPSGTLNVSSCKFGAPAFVSFPHFYLADESYRTNISGMNPDPEKHHFTLVIEPHTGIPMQVHAAMQINLLLQPDSHFRLSRDVPKTFIPMLWFTQKANLSSVYASQARTLVMVHTGAYAILGLFVAIGVLLLGVGIFIFMRHRQRTDDNQILITNSDG